MLLQRGVAVNALEPFQQNCAGVSQGGALQDRFIVYPAAKHALWDVDHDDMHFQFLEARFLEYL